MASDSQERPILVYGEDAAQAHAVAQRATALLGTGPAIELHDSMTPRAILAQARNRRVGAIVVGSHGGPPHAGPLPGDVSTAVAHRAAVPVLIVRAHDDTDAASEGDRPILVCYDGSDEAQAAVDAAAELLPGREIVVVSVLEPVDDIPLLRQTLPWPPSGETEERVARLDQQQAEFISQLHAEGAARAAARGREARGFSAEGSGPVSNRLLELADELDASCIVVGHRSAIPPPDSTALRLVRHSRRPVLVVPG